MPLTRLILLRHGKAEQRSASGHDFDRALTERGRTECRRTGARLAEAGFTIELALVSAAVRARQTWDEAGLAFREAMVEHRRDLYQASAGELLEEAGASGVANVAVVGHNPSIHALAYELAARGKADPVLERRLHEGFPTAAAAVFRFEGGAAFCEAVMFPRDEEEA